MRRSWFRRVVSLNSYGREQPSFDLTRDGFTARPLAENDGWNRAAVRAKNGGDLIVLASALSRTGMNDAKPSAIMLRQMSDSEKRRAHLAIEQAGRTTEERNRWSAWEFAGVRRRAADMSKARFKKRNAIVGQFAARTIEMLRSAAWRVLSLAAHRVLDRLEIERAQHGGQDNGRLPVTFEQFVEYGLHRHSVAPAIRELGGPRLRRGDRARSRREAGYRRPNLFRVTYHPDGTEDGKPSHEWRGVKTLAEAEARARAARAAKAEGWRPEAGQKHKPSAGYCRASRDGFRHYRPGAGFQHSNTTVSSGDSVTTSIVSGGSPRLRHVESEATPGEEALPEAA